MMVEGHNHQLSLSETGCTSKHLVADKNSDSVTRVLVALPGFCYDSHRDDIVAELKDVLAGPTYCLRVFSFSDGVDVGRFRSRFFVKEGIVSHIHYLRALMRQLVTVDVLHLVYHSGVSFAKGILPSAMLAKFFGKRVVLDYRTPIMFSPRLGERFLVERLWRLCDRILVLSAYQQQLVNSFGGKAGYIRAGVDLDRVTPRVVKNLQPRIVVATDLEREHNVASAIRAFKLVKQKYPRTEMTILGVGSEETVLRDIVEREKIYGVTFAGAVTGRRRTALIEESDLYLNCSSVDYLTSATAEAFAAGLPVLTTPLSGGGEVLRSREHFILLPYNDHVGTAERIIELLENPELTEKLSRNSRRTGEGYSSRQRREQWVRFYRNLSRGSD